MDSCEVRGDKARVGEESASTKSPSSDDGGVGIRNG